MKERRKIIGKTKIDRIISQQTRESCGIQPINVRAERRDWDEHLIRMNHERLVKISKKDLQAARKEDGAT